MNGPSLTELTRVFGKIGVLSFGGPAAQIALMHRELVETRGWLSEQAYLRALSLCMILPGPEAMQLATYAGWRLRGVAGGLIGGLLFVVPGALVIAVLALAYARFGEVPLVQSAFTGIKAAVVVIVAQALWRLSRKALTGWLARGLAAGAFVALFAAAVPFPVVILSAGLIGAIWMRRAAEADGDCAEPVRFAETLRTATVWSTVWLVPLGAVLVLDPEFLGPLAVFFSTLAVVTFGGAYAVLAYMTQAVVSEFGWLSTSQMIDALGLAETTPGPLILVTQFVAMLAGLGQGGVWMGILAGIVALWVTFVPCFLWIFTAAPYVDSLARRPRLNAALSAITAAVVGVIAQLGLWFALHVLFAGLGRWGAMPVPDLASLDLKAALLVVLAVGLLIWRRVPVPAALAGLAAAGVILG